ncbi:hypothetical protein LCGC14_1432790 [marine sediment metagenome]|uniref:Uncharacterized protein n=1 Tax=marine sediment metagenome TaxID=412755 RepID=A0A0F9K997_9ZZZZ
MKMNKQQLKAKIEKDLKYDLGGTLVSGFVSLVCIYYLNIPFLMFFVIMTLVFFNSYLITKREKQIMEVLG